MAAAKNGLDKLATGIGAVRRTLQDLIAPELRQHTTLLLQHAEGINGIVQVLREQTALLREHGERLARIEGRLEGIDGRLVSLERRLESMDGRLVGVEKSLAAIDARLDRVLEMMRESPRSKDA